jgi:hypothetical protein
MDLEKVRELLAPQHFESQLDVGGSFGHTVQAAAPSLESMLKRIAAVLLETAEGLDEIKRMIAAGTPPDH